jgi:hypothetical protein
MRCFITGQGLGSVCWQYLARALLAKRPERTAARNMHRMVERRTHPDLRLIEMITYDDEGNHTGR